MSSDSSLRATRGGGTLAVVVALALAGCVSVGVQQPWDPQGRYVCEDGKTFVVAFREDGSSVTVTLDGGQLILPQTVGATDAKFSDGRATLYLEAPRALLEISGQVFARGCVKQ